VEELHTWTWDAAARDLVVRPCSWPALAFVVVEAVAVTTWVVGADAVVASDRPLLNWYN
jgi:hypothetical protein